MSYNSGRQLLAKAASEPLALVRCRSLMPMCGEKACAGKDLYNDLAVIDNGAILLANGVIVETGNFKSLKIPPKTKIYDLGDKCVLPSFVNAHSHLQLSWLKEKLEWGNGFAAWLKSMLPPLLQGMESLARGESREIYDALDRACASLAAAGIFYVGDIGGSIPGMLTAVRNSAQKHGLLLYNFCEWLGYDDDSALSPWPKRCRQEIAETGDWRCAPAGHALYSTSAEIMRACRLWCAAHDRVFTFHLAESEAETEMLLYGTGPIKAFYEKNILPANWQAPGLRPFALAHKSDLIAPGTLAVHGVHLDDSEIAEFAQSGAFLCLCPRSNANLGVGTAPVQKLMDANVLCCLGTDGLTSNTDLEVQKEAVWLREKLDIEENALTRMLTVNGYQALGLPALSIAPGQPAYLALLPWTL